MVTTYARRPEASNFLEVKRWVTRILFEAFEGEIGELLDVPDKDL